MWENFVAVIQFTNSHTVYSSNIYTPGRLFPSWLHRPGAKTRPAFINLHDRQVYWWCNWQHGKQRQRQLWEDECDQRPSYIQVRLDPVYRGGTSHWSRRRQRAWLARCRCDEGRLCCRAHPLLYLPSFMVLPETWWPYPLRCYRKVKAWSQPHPRENALIHAMVSRPQPVTSVYLRPGFYYLCGLT